MFLKNCFLFFRTGNNAENLLALFLKISIFLPGEKFIIKLSPLYLLSSLLLSYCFMYHQMSGLGFVLLSEEMKWASIGFSGPGFHFQYVAWSYKYLGGPPCSRVGPTCVMVADMLLHYHESPHIYIYIYIYIYIWSDGSFCWAHRTC